MVGTFKPNKGNSSEWEWKLNTCNNIYGTRNKGKQAAAAEETEERNNNSVVVSTMYITNFPSYMDSQDLRKICGGVGTVSDVYLPRKLSKSGKRFAFVRFRLRVDDESELAKKLSAIWIGNYHLFATLARHENEKKPFYQSQTRKEGRNLNNNQSKTYANIVTGMKQIAVHDSESQDMVEEDRISALPDCLLLEILSRLPFTKDAIRTGTLSKRWEQLWTCLPTLIFQHSKNVDNHSRSEFVLLVDETLTQCGRLKLKQFKITFTSYDSRYGWQVNNWIHYAIRRNVEELYVVLSKDDGSPPYFWVDQSFFICSCFTNLRVAGCKLNPDGAISWKNLKILWISYEKLHEDLIENILSGSPLLETLVLDYCYGYRRLNITSKILRNLVFCGHDIIEINAPNILSLTIQDYQRFRKPLLVDVSSLVEANLDYITLGYYEDEEAEEEENLIEFILDLPYVKEIKIGGVKCAEVASRLEAKGFDFPSNMKVVKSGWFSSGLVQSKDL